jgi:hypothetical protein
VKAEIHLLLIVVVATADAAEAAATAQGGARVQSAATQPSAPAGGTPPSPDSKISLQVEEALERIRSDGITRANARIRRASTHSSLRVRVDDEARVQVYIRVQEINDAALFALRAAEADVEIVNAKRRQVQARVPFDRIAEISALPFVEQVTQPDYAVHRAGSVTTAGDAILRADELRSAGFTGAGVKVGIISDGAAGRAAARNSGDLPDDIKVYGSCTPAAAVPSQCAPRALCAEGTAIAEIIHDIAPETELAIAAASTDLDFIERVDQLVNDFGADIVIDDLGYFGQPYFADGDIAQAVAAVTDQVLFVSAAGNDGIGHHEAQFIPMALQVNQAHNFGKAAGGANDATMNVRVPPGQILVGFLQWNDRFGDSANNYNLLLLDTNELSALCPYCIGDEKQTGFQDPLEVVCYYNGTSFETQGRLVVEKIGGLNRRFELFLLGGGFTNDYNQPGGSIFGHPALTDVVAVAAIDAADAGHNTVEPYSSRGPARLEFPALEIRPKPDIAAIDGVAVTGAAGFPSLFFGTSAAAPHVAAIAALLKHAEPEATPAMLRSALAAGAVDLGTNGRDSVSGMGRIDAVAALDELRNALPAEDADSDGVSDGSDNCPTDANTDQADADGDAAGDACDGDDDGDGLADAGDNCPLVSNIPQANTDGDGEGDACDSDDDDDGMADAYEIANALNPLDPGDAMLDGDADGLSNLQEAQFGSAAMNTDSDSDGIADGVEAAAGRHPAANEPALLQIMDDIIRD